MALADELWGSLAARMLCLADRNFYSYERFQEAHSSGAQLLWRVRSNGGLPREQALEDGSYLMSIYPVKDRRAKRDGTRTSFGEPGRPLPDRRPEERHSFRR